MREVTTQEVAECLRRMTRNRIPDIASVIVFKDAVNNNALVEDMSEEEFINDFLPCAIMAFTQIVYDKICPVTKSEGTEMWADAAARIKESEVKPLPEPSTPPDKAHPRDA